MTARPAHLAIPSTTRCVPKRPACVPAARQHTEACVPDVFPPGTHAPGAETGNRKIRPIGPDLRCALGGIRTPGRLIRSQVLYPD